MEIELGVEWSISAHLLATGFGATVTKTYAAIYLSVWQIHIWQENFKLSVVLCFTSKAQNNPSLLSFYKFCTVRSEDLSVGVAEMLDTSHTK